MRFSVILLFLTLPIQDQFTNTNIWNVDEAQMVVQAKMFQQGRIPWTEVDTTTSGPLNSLWLNLTNFIYDTPTIQSTRILARLTLSLSVFFTFLGFLNFFSLRISWLLILPLSFAIGLNHIPSLSGYHSGILPTLFFALSFYFWSCWKKHQELLPLQISLGLAGLQFMIKAQVAPAAFLWASFIIFDPKVAHGRGKLIVSFLLPCFLALLPTLKDYGVVDFLVSYIVAGIKYGPHLTVPDLEVQQFQIPFNIQLWLMGGSIFVALWSLRQTRKDAFFWQLMMMIACVFFPGYFIQHYFGLLYLPATLAMGLVLGDILQKGKNAQSFFGTFIICGIGIGLLQFDRLNFIRNFVQPQQRFYGEVIKGKKIDRLVIWGWSPQIYLFADAVPDTRDAITQSAMLKNELQDYYLLRFIADMEYKKSPWFLDTVCDYGLLVKTCELHNYPALETYILKNYVLEQELDKKVKLWKRKKSF